MGWLENTQVGHWDHLECENYHGACIMCRQGGERTQLGHHDNLECEIYHAWDKYSVCVGGGGEGTHAINFGHHDHLHGIREL